MADKFGAAQGVSDSLNAPARELFLITPHDTNPVDPLPKAIRANAAGAVTLRAAGSGTDVTIAMAAGEVLDVRAEYIRDTGTDAIVIHGLA